jgi:hypothetical protein
MTPIWNKPLAWLVDGAMCNMMHVLQWRRRADVCSKEELDDYIVRHSPMTREEFYRMPAAARPSLKNGMGHPPPHRPPGKRPRPRSFFSRPGPKRTDRSHPPRPYERERHWLSPARRVVQ